MKNTLVFLNFVLNGFHCICSGMYVYNSSTLFKYTVCVVNSTSGRYKYMYRVLIYL